MTEAEELGMEIVMTGAGHLSKFQWEIVKRIVDEEFAKQSNKIKLSEPNQNIRKQVNRYAKEIT